MAASESGATSWRLIHGAGAYGNCGQSSEYQRGFKDGQRGTWDQNKHNQEYKDGYRDGERARWGN
jgi:hypothetical protein